MIKILIKRNNEYLFTIDVNQYETILHLKQIVFEKTGYLPDQQRLVFGGKVMDDNMTLSFYKVADNSQIYFVPKKNSVPKKTIKQIKTNSIATDPKPNPMELLQKMAVLLEQLPEIRAEDFSNTISEIKEIINNPTVQSFARIDEDAKQLIKNARDIISISERPISQKTKDFIAKSKDSFLDRFDSTPEGLRILQSLLNDDNSDLNFPSPAHPSRSYSSISQLSDNKSCSITHPSFSTNFQKDIINQSNDYSDNNNYNNNYSNDEEAIVPNSNYQASNTTNLRYRSLISTRPLPKIWSDSQSADNEESVQRVKLTRAPGMSFSLFMRSESGSESESDDENDETNSQSKNSSASQSKNVFQRAALRMSAPKAPIFRITNSKMANVSSNSNGFLARQLREQNSGTFNNNESQITLSAANLSVTESCDSSINKNPTRYFGKNLNGLSKIQFNNSDNENSALNSDSNLPVVKANSSDNKNSPNFQIPLKSKFAEQMDELKNMGFDDENVVLQALSETNGNVKMAEKILKEKF